MLTFLTTSTATISEVTIEANLRQFLLVIAVSLTVAILPQIFSWFRQIPYTLLLVIVGLGLALADVRLVNLSPGLILGIFLPPLLFEAAWNLEWFKLKRDWVPISLYAVLGVVISVVGVAFALNQITGISLAIALLVGASVSATDPISVIALFRELGVEKRLAILMEGESLFNDGIAVVAFSSLMGFSLGQGEISFQSLLIQFLTVISIGVAVGSAIGFGLSYFTQRFDLPLVEQSLTLISAYGTYLITEDLGGSGVIGVVTTGLILGNFGSCVGMKPSTRLSVTQFWNFLAFFVNSIVFLLIGDQINFNDLRQNSELIAVTVVAVLITRAVSVYGLGWLSNKLAKAQISLAYQTVVWWGGLRGSVSIALALSVPVTLAEREKTIATVFGVVLFTLLIQGLTTKSVLQKLGLLNRQELNQQYLEAIAHRVALYRVLNHLSQIANRQEMDPDLHHHFKTRIQEKVNAIQLHIDQLQEQHPQLMDLTINQLQEDLLGIETDTYAQFMRLGQLKELPPSVLREVFLSNTPDRI